MFAETKTTTAEALLGLLSIRPMSGYEIKQMIESSIGNFWSESFGQIYPTLRRLEGGGWIVAEKPARASKDEGRASRRYRITALGCERLHAWLPVPARQQVPRNELLLKLFFGADASISVMREQIASARAAYVAAVERYERIGAGMAKTRANLPGYPYWKMTLRYGMAEAKAMVAWADESLAALTELERSTAVTKGKRRQHHAA